MIFSSSKAFLFQIFTIFIAIHLIFPFNCGFAPENVDKVQNTPQGHLGFYPWVGALCLVAPEGSFSSASRSCFCTSTLVSPRFVLTAGHCLHAKKASQIEVVLGSADYLNGREALAVPARRLAIHPEYIFDEQGGPNDIGLIELAFPLPIVANGRIHPICLNSSLALSDRELGVVAGWGWVKNNQPGECAQPMSLAHPMRTHLLHQGHVQIVLDPRKCILRNGARPFTPDKEICTKGWDANPQHGDSGGPLMVKRLGRWHQIGVASYGECHEEGRVPERLPDIFTSIQFYCPWIRQQSGGEVQC